MVCNPKKKIIIIYIQLVLFESSTYPEKSQPYLCDYNDKGSNVIRVYWNNLNKITNYLVFRKENI